MVTDTTSQAVYSIASTVSAYPAPRGGDGDDDNNEKVTFDERQQARVNDLIKESMGRAGREARAEADTVKAEIATLRTELEEAKTALKTAGTSKEKKEAQGDVDGLKSQIAEMQNAHKTVTTELERLRQVSQQREVEVKNAKDATLNVRKEVVLTNAAAKINPFEVDTVVSMTKDSVKWDEDKSSFVVVDPASGQTRLNSAFEPMSLDEFYAEFASKKPYLVRGSTKMGSGSSESGRFDVANNGKYEVTQIFGPKSDSRLANELGLKNPTEYKRLKQVAIDAGIVPGARSKR